MKKAAAGKSDILRAIEKDPELRPMVEHYFRPKLSEREPFEAFITDFNARASALYPNWQDVWDAAKSDGRIVRWLAMHCVLRIRERSDLTERERYEAKTAEADFGTSYDEIVGAPSTAAAFRMALACYSADRKITSICADFLVELRGIEPLTSAVRLQRSPI